MVNAASVTTRLTSAVGSTSELSGRARHGRPIGELGGGRLAPAPQAGPHGVDGESPAERQEGRPDDELAEHPVAAVLDQRDPRVQADQADRRQEPHQRRPPADQQRQVDEPADEKPEDRLLAQRREEEEREHPLRRRPPEQRVVRQEAVVRIEEVEHRNAAHQIDQQDDRHRDAPERHAPRVDGQILLEEPPPKRRPALEPCARAPSWPLQEPALVEIGRLGLAGFRGSAARRRRRRTW